MRPEFRKSTKLRKKKQENLSPALHLDFLTQFFVKEVEKRCRQLKKEKKIERRVALLLRLQRVVDSILLPHQVLWELEKFSDGIKPVQEKGGKVLQPAEALAQAYLPPNQKQRRLIQKIMRVLTEEKMKGNLVVSYPELSVLIQKNTAQLDRVLRTVGSSSLMDFLHKMRNWGFVLLFSLNEDYYIYAKP